MIDDITQMFGIQKTPMKMLVFDLETAGLDSERHQIFEFGGVVIQGCEILDRICLKLKYLGGPVEIGALKKTKRNLITWDEDPEVLPLDGFSHKLSKFLFDNFQKEVSRGERIILAGHNILNFDIPFLMQFWDVQAKHIFRERFDKVFSKITMDTMVVALFMYRVGLIDYFEFNLESLLETFGITHDKDSLHSALADAMLTTRLLLAMDQMQHVKSACRNRYESLVLRLPAIYVRGNANEVYQLKTFLSAVKVTIERNQKLTKAQSEQLEKYYEQYCGGNHHDTQTGDNDLAANRPSQELDFNAGEQSPGSSVVS